MLTLVEWISDGYKEPPQAPACTSVTQQWDKPRGAKISPAAVSEMTIVNTAQESKQRKRLEAVFEDNQYVY